MNAQDFRNVLCKNIIPFWNRMADKEYGGFYGYADAAGVPDKKSDKGVILNSRILWFYSSAYLLLKEEKLLENAGHAYRFLIEKCLDKENGGVYWAVDFKGNVSEDMKHTYSQAFAVYALSAYYEACGEPEALKTAMDIYHVMEEKCKDEGGYLESFGRDFTLSKDNEKLSENGVTAQRTMNTILHVMEAYTVLYKVNPCEELQKSMEEIADILRDKIYNDQTKRLEVFFDREYHSLIDLESYGHDIEASWLIARAIEVFNKKEITEKLDPIVDILAETTYKNGLMGKQEALYNECENGVDDTRRVWWVQAEAVTGFYNIFQRHPEKTEYKTVSENIFAYIQEHFMDKEHGEWLENIYDEEEKNKNQARAHQWKCPYHNGRMCMEMMQRLAH